MANRKRIISGLVLAAVYAFFFASTNFFYHSHIISDVKIVHSHPWSGSAHSHSADQITLIEVLDSAVYEESETLVAPVPVPMAVCRTASELTESPAFSVSVLTFSLRAPPAQS